MFQIIFFMAIYCIYFGTEQIINHLHEQNIENEELDEYQYYYFQDKNGEIDLRAPIFMSLKE